jgi:outer membrane protein assembly factor BamB
MTKTKLVAVGCAAFLILLAPAIRGDEADKAAPIWPQWRGPTRDGQVCGPAWPDNLKEDCLKQRWRLKLGPSYSGPVVAADRLFVTETRDNKSEVVRALDRKTGKELWRAEWPGAITVPFFAASNGSWIRSTPTLDGESLFVAGMQDVLVSLNAKTGKEQWRIDFVKDFKAALPAFGFVSSPLVDGDAVYVQAGASFVKLDKTSGKVVWRVLKDDGGMMGGAFSSPTIATLAGQRQILVQTREKLVGVDPKTGDILWEQNVPNFRGMNILTPVPFGDAVFTSSYSKKSWLYAVSRKDEKFQVSEAWSNNVQGYMSTPVVIDGHAYLHLQNQRFTCINLTTGERTWTSQAFGRYWSLVARKDRILALDQRGKLLLIKANPKKFELLDEREISDQETWAHLAVCGHEVYVRELSAITAYQWK